MEALVTYMVNVLPTLCPRKQNCVPSLDNLSNLRATGQHQEQSSQIRLGFRKQLAFVDFIGPDHLLKSKTKIKIEAK